MGKRAQFATKTGVIAATVGSAVGLGNIWRFPYEAGTHGGGAFLCIYIACVLLVGIPVMLAEFVIGRGTHLGPKGAFAKLHKSRVFQALPFMGIVASLMILSFYSVVAGWIMQYLYQSIADLFTKPTSADYASEFNAFISNPWWPLVWTLLFLAINYWVLQRGIEKGIERVSNILMPLLFILLVVFGINSLMLPQATYGLRFLFMPDFSQLTPSVVIGAMGQAFFSLSLGLTCLMTYASYFNDDTRLVKSASTIAILDTIVALMAGIIIFPAVFSFGVEPQAGPKLVFETLPSIFAQMPGGDIWAIMFFTLLFFAAVTSTISMSEISISYFVEELHLSRRKATSLSIAIAMFFGSLCALSFGELSEFKLFDMTLFDLFDYVSSNILLPLGGIIISIFAGWVVERKYVDNQLGAGSLISPALAASIRFCMRYVAPTAIIAIFIYGLL